jgi:hypothetical protein
LQHFRLADKKVVKVLKISLFVTLIFVHLAFNKIMK